MLKSSQTVFALALAPALVFVGHARAQSPAATQEPAPIERATPSPGQPPAPPMRGGWQGERGWRHAPEAPRPHASRAERPRAVVEQPLPGVRVVATEKLSTVSRTRDTAELRLERGRAQVSVDHPDGNPLILLDLPGGQADLVHDGLYTVNAETHTLRVLRGEADVFLPDAPADAKGVTVHEGEEVVFNGKLEPHTVSPEQERADLLYPERSTHAAPRWDDGGWDGPGYVAYGYGYPAYGYGGWGWPAYAGWGWGSPWYGWGYPYGAWGSPWYGGWGVGVGLGWGGYGGGWGGYHGGWGGYRGGYHSGGWGGGGFRPGHTGGGSGGGFRPGGSAHHH